MNSGTDGKVMVMDCSDGDGSHSRGSVLLTCLLAPTAGWPACIHCWLAYLRPLLACLLAPTAGLPTYRAALKLAVRECASLHTRPEGSEAYHVQAHAGNMVDWPDQVLTKYRMSPELPIANLKLNSVCAEEFQVAEQVAGKWVLLQEALKKKLKQIHMRGAWEEMENKKLGLEISEKSHEMAVFWASLKYKKAVQGGR